jgi:hypothetical protein
LYTYDVILSFNPSDQPNVAVLEVGYATVMKFDGTNWTNIGPERFSGQARYLSFAFSPTGQPYVAYMDYTNSSKATVMKYDTVYVGISVPQESRLSLYPDPAVTILTIDIKPVNSNLKFAEIYEIRGKKIFETQTDKDRIILNVENYPVGMYIVKLNTESSNWIGKFCKD